MTLGTCGFFFCHLWSFKICLLFIFFSFLMFHDSANRAHSILMTKLAPCWLERVLHSVFMECLHRPGSAPRCEWQAPILRELGEDRKEIKPTRVTCPGGGLIRAFTRVKAESARHISAGTRFPGRHDESPGCVSTNPFPGYSECSARSYGLQIRTRFFFWH